MIFFGFEINRFLFLFQYELLFCIQDLEDSVSYAYVKVKLEHFFLFDYFLLLYSHSYVMHLTSIFSLHPMMYS